MPKQRSDVQLPLSKPCSRCGEDKPLIDFSPMPTGRDGLRTWCNPCEAARVRAYYAEFPERKKKSARRDYERHGDAIRRRVRQYARENAEVVRQRKRDYYAENKWRWLGIGTARRRNASRPSIEARSYMDLLYGDPCCYCGEPMEHIDHIVAVSRGGSGDWDNLTAACQPCNRRKYNISLLTFMLERSKGER